MALSSVAIMRNMRIFLSFLLDLLNLNRVLSISRTSFAAPIKQIAKSMFGFTKDQINGDQKEIIDPNWGLTPRQIMQDIGMNFRNIHKDIFAKKLVAEINKKRASYKEEVILINSDCRFLNELEFTKKNLDSTCYIRIDRQSIRLSGMVFGT